MPDQPETAREAELGDALLALLTPAELYAIAGGSFDQKRNEYLVRRGLAHYHPKHDGSGTYDWVDLVPVAEAARVRLEALVAATPEREDAPPVESANEEPTPTVESAVECIRREASWRADR